MDIPGPGPERPQASEVTPPPHDPDSGAELEPDDERLSIVELRRELLAENRGQLLVEGLLELEELPVQGRPGVGRERLQALGRRRVLFEDRLRPLDVGL